MKKALAIDVGGTKIYNTIVNELGEVVGEIEKRHTPKTYRLKNPRLRSGL